MHTPRYVYRQLCTDISLSGDRYMRIRVLAAAVLPLLLLSALGHAYASPGRGMLIVVTFPSIAKDLELIACPGDKVVSLVPPGTDPHDYQLRTSDVDTLRRADLVVSTAHAPFEIEIRELVQQGEIDAKLIEIPRVPGLTILRNPATGKPNLHMPIYSPQNYEVFMRRVVEVLEELNPESARCYEERFAKVINELREAVRSATPLNVTAVADTPVVQYAVEWMGVSLGALMVRERGAPLAPQDLRVAEDMLAKHRAVLVVVTEPPVHKASQKLLELAERFGVPVLRVPSPATPTSMLSKITYVANESRVVAGLLRTTRETEVQGSYVISTQPILILALAALGAAVGGVALWRLGRH